jgi:hypothetical protein
MKKAEAATASFAFDVRDATFALAELLRRRTPASGSPKLFLEVAPCTSFHRGPTRPLGGADSAPGEGLD